MKANLSKAWQAIGDMFWIIPATVIGVCALLALGALHVDHSGLVPSWLIDSELVYSGGATGARTLLGAVASSTIGVAGTVFSITIAALSLAAGQMGPRLLRNFTRDRGNQLTLGVFLGTFCYALLVLRSVRSDGTVDFVPHLSLSIGMLLGFVCVGMLVFFVGHIAGRINVDTVIDLVSADVRDTMARLTLAEPPVPATEGFDFDGGTVLFSDANGYLQHFDRDGLADWAAANETMLHVLVRPGSYVYPGAPIAVIASAVDGAAAAIRSATAFGSQRVSGQDLEYAVRQLEEVAVRALSPGINDPHTAISVLVRLGAALCALVGRHLPGGVIMRAEKPVLTCAAVTYEGLTDAMFHMIRQNATGSTAVLASGLDVMIAVASVERTASRLATLRRHADLWIGDARRSLETPADLADVERRYAAFLAMQREGPLPRVCRGM